MQDTGFFADIWYANILHLLWLVIDTDADISVYLFPTPDGRDCQVSPVVECTYSVIMHTTVSVHRHKIALNDVIFILCAKEEKYLVLTLCKTRHFMTIAFKQKGKMHPTLNWMMRSLTQSEHYSQPGQICPDSQVIQWVNITSVHMKRGV